MYEVHEPHLVLQGPGECCGRLQVEPGEGVLTGDDEDNEGQFEDVEQLREVVLDRRRGEVITLYHQFRVLLLDGVRELFVHLPVPSGVAATYYRRQSEFFLLNLKKDTHVRKGFISCLYVTNCSIYCTRLQFQKKKAFSAAN